MRTYKYDNDWLKIKISLGETDYLHKYGIFNYNYIGEPFTLYTDENKHFHQTLLCSLLIDVQYLIKKYNERNIRTIN